jgi:hypothetical protein
MGQRVAVDRYHPPSDEGVPDFDYELGIFDFWLYRQFYYTSCTLYLVKDLLC